MLIRYWGFFPSHFIAWKQLLKLIYGGIIGYLNQLLCSDHIIPSHITWYIWGAVVLSHIHLFETLWTVPGLCPWDLFRQECWSGLPFPSPGGPPDLGIVLHCRWILYFWAIREPWREGFIIDDILALAVPLFLLSSLAAAASLDKHS